MTHKIATDEELMHSYSLGNETAFLELYKRYAGKVLGFLRLKLRDSKQADDIFQATFLNLHKYRSRYDASLPFAPWLFTLCRNCWIDHMKANSKMTFVAESTEPSAPEAVEELNFASLPHWNDLSPNQQAAVELRYRDELAFADIASRLKTGESNVRQLLSRALKKLRSTQ